MQKGLLKNMKNRFSLAMCLYEKDNPAFFKLSIDSIIQQTVLPNQIVLVVD